MVCFTYPIVKVLLREQAFGHSVHRLLDTLLKSGSIHYTQNFEDKTTLGPRCR